MKDKDPFESEMELLRNNFDLEEILDFERKHRIEVELDGTGQYGCKLDGNTRYHGMGFTAMYAIWHAMKMYKRFSTPISTKMDFGQALRELKAGRRIARTGWNGKGMFLFLLPAGTIPKTAIHDPALKKVLENNGSDHFEALGSIRMLTVDGKILTGWLASQTDMLSEDWMVIQD